MEQFIHNVLQFIHSLSSLIDVTNPSGLAIVFGIVAFADIGLAIPFILEPALFLITFQSGPISLSVLLFVLMLACGRQAGTAILYWSSRFIGEKIGRIISRFFPGFAARFSQRLERFEKRLGTRQTNVLIVARLTPGLLQISTIASGALHINYIYVMIATFISGLIYDAAIVMLGTLAHYGLQGLNPDYSIYFALGIAVLIALIFFAVDRIRHRKSKDEP
jgi:membrane protein DedA with SNARE-associated domain